MSDKKIMKTLNGYTVYDEDAHRRIDSLEGAAPGLVFDTVADMEAYVAEHHAELKVGQNLYIREVDVPDYWWDGTAAQELEAKEDLSGYAKQEEVDQLSKAIADLEKVLTVTSDELAAMSQEELTEMYGQGVRLLVVGEGENLVPTAISSSGVVLNGCGYLANYRLNSSGEIIVSDRAVMTGFIPFEYGKTVEITGGLNTAENGGQYIAAYDDTFNLLYVNYLASLIRDSGSEVCGIDNIRTYTVNTSAFAQSTNINGFKDAAYIRISINPGVGGKLRVRYI